MPYDGNLRPTAITRLADDSRLLMTTLCHMVPTGESYDKLSQMARGIDDQILSLPAESLGDVVTRLKMVRETLGDYGWFVDGLLDACIQDLQAMNS